MRALPSDQVIQFYKLYVVELVRSDWPEETEDDDSGEVTEETVVIRKSARTELIELLDFAAFQKYFEDEATAKAEYHLVVDKVGETIFAMAGGVHEEGDDLMKALRRKMDYVLVRLQVMNRVENKEPIVNASVKELMLYYAPGDVSAETYKKVQLSVEKTSADKVLIRSHHAGSIKEDVKANAACVLLSKARNAIKSHVQDKLHVLFKTMSEPNADGTQTRVQKGIADAVSWQKELDRELFPIFALTVGHKYDAEMYGSNEAAKTEQASNFSMMLQCSSTEVGKGEGARP